MSAGKTKQELSDAIDLGDVEAEAQQPIAKKYDEQMRQLVTQKLDIPLRSVLQMLDSKQLNVAPDFQRRDRWDLKKQSRFIESIIMNVPIPPVFLGEDEYGSYVVLDGRQRLTAVSEYLRNNFALDKSLEVWPELGGKRFNELGDVKNFILRRFVPAVVILKESSSEIKYDVFDRLNTGGVVANQMEIRNSIYRGKFTDSMKKISGNKVFRQLWGIPLDPPALEENEMYAQMEDIEFVLRFFAFQDWKSFKGRLKEYLNDFMKAKNTAYEADPQLLAKDAATFERAADSAFRIFGADAFRKPPVNGRLSARSFPLADAIMYGCSQVDASTFNDAKIKKAKDGLLEVFGDQKFVDSMSRGTNGKTAIGHRLESIAAVLKIAQS